ncbi:MAG: outer membrane lipoprotein-sorting protein [Vicinamibacterales bacterium]
MLRFLLVLALLAPIQTSPSLTSPSLTADAIARRMQDRDTGRDSRSTMRMRLFDRHGRVRERALSMLSLRGRGNPGAAPTAPDGDRLLLRFLYPNDIRGTGFLVWEHPGAEDERFLYLPSLGRVRRIAGAETQESFVGSDFTYEDIGGRELDEYTYAIVDEHASWTPPAGGAARPAWRLESRRRDASAQFPRVVSLVLKDSFMVVHADIYNRRNEKQKAYSVRRLDRVEMIWTAMESEMTNALEKSRTELVIEKMDFNAGVKESDFTRRELERGHDGR